MGGDLDTAILKTCAAAAMLLAAQSAIAQTADRTADTAAGVMILPSISITATRNPIDAFEYPGMVTVIGRRGVEDTQASSPDDLLRYTPGIEFLGGPRRTGETPSIRGFGGDDVVILLDGARQNFISGHNGRFFVDPLFLRQVEVVRGSSSALYGSGGTGGIIELRTVEAGDYLGPTDSYAVETLAGHQSVNQEWSAGVIGSARPTKNLALVGGATWRTSDDIELGDGSMRQSQDNILSGLFKAQLEPWENHDVEFSWQRFNNKAEEPANGQDPAATDVVDKDVLTDNFRLAYGYSNPANPLVDFKTLAYYTESEVEETALTTTSTRMVGDVSLRNLRTVGLKADNRSRVSFGDDFLSIFTYGVDAYRDRGDGSFNGGPRGGVPSAETIVTGTFVQGQFEFENVLGSPVGVTAIPGLRYDFYTSESDDSPDGKTSSELSPKFALQVRPVEPLMLFGSYAKAFRAPNLNEMFPTGTHFTFGPFTNSFIPNPGLEPQTTTTYEIGAGLRYRSLLTPGDQLQIKGSRFWIRGKDFIDFQVLTFTSQFVNVESARLYGYELEGSYENRRLLFEAGFSHIDGENEATEAPLGVLTPDKFTFHTAVKLPEYRSRVGWRFTLADNFDNTMTASQIRGGYHTSDIYATWHAAEDDPLAGFGVTVGIDNLFDREYERTAKDAFEAGRNYKATIRYTKRW